MNNTDQTYLLWIDGKPTKISSDKKCLASPSNQANRMGASTKVTCHTSYKEATDTLLSGISFDDYMDEEVNPNQPYEAIAILENEVITARQEYLKTFESLKNCDECEGEEVEALETEWREAFNNLKGAKARLFEAIAS